MPIPTNAAISLAVAIGIGLLIGAERERRKGTGSGRSAAGVRTFALAAFAGALSSYLQSEALLVVIAFGAMLFAALAYRQTAREDPGLTTEFALLVTVLLGALTVKGPLLAAGLAVITTILLASRESLHSALKHLLSEQEVHDALVFLAASLVVLPLAPNRELGPFHAFNPRKIWELVVLVIAVGGLGHICLRAFGARLGFALTGLAGGFISASATIGSMGNRAKRSPELANAAASGATLATVATVIQMFLVLSISNVLTFRATTRPLLLAGIVAIAYALIFFSVPSTATTKVEPTAGKAFDLRFAIVFAFTISVSLFLLAFMNQRFGSRGLLVGSAVAGFADTHATAISIASLVSSGKLAPESAVLPILLGFATNTVTKIVVAFSVGGSRFGLKILFGLVAVVLAAFLGMGFRANS